MLFYKQVMTFLSKFCVKIDEGSYFKILVFKSSFNQMVQILIFYILLKECAIINFDFSLKKEN